MTQSDEEIKAGRFAMELLVLTNQNMITMMAQLIMKKMEDDVSTPGGRKSLKHLQLCLILNESNPTFVEAFLQNLVEGTDEELDQQLIEALESADDIYYPDEDLSLPDAREFFGEPPDWLPLGDMVQDLEKIFEDQMERERCRLLGLEPNPETPEAEDGTTPCPFEAMSPGARERWRNAETRWLGIGMPAGEDEPEPEGLEEEYDFDEDPEDGGDHIAVKDEQKTETEKLFTEETDDVKGDDHGHDDADEDTDPKSSVPVWKVEAKCGRRSGARSST